MADISTCPPLTPASVRAAYTKIKPYIHRTPLVTSRSLDAIASSRDPSVYLSDNPPPFDSPTSSSNDSDAAVPPPRFRLHFKCENFQKIGAFKARGAFHAVTRLVDELGLDEVRRRGVVTHSSGNHAQALALAASTFDIPAYIVMPAISTRSKIAGTRLYTPHVLFSGSTAEEREAVVGNVVEEKGAILVPPYDHPDIILGQGTVGLEMEEQFRENQSSPTSASASASTEADAAAKKFDAVLAPIGGGGLLCGVATFFASQPDTPVFGAEPSFEGADDARRGLLQNKRIEHVKTLTIADGLRTPVGKINWTVVSDPTKVAGVYAVSEDEIKKAMRFVFERLKLVVEPSGCVPLAVVLFNQEFRDMVAEKQREQQKAGAETPCWDVGVVFSGGNTTMKAIATLFGEGVEEDAGVEAKREAGKVGVDGTSNVEDVAG
ncbi:hypothetical protein Z517_11989 [Fonsecaea pedrosoi CBS 271.37]|uniref:Unplaced genomic scaffold supercont1.8, whole genome shotgun sequence n=1 Tax=Fonsecaea pedrosoi CBS 271.37 TaxID=1442368 RepID=A0A0D2G8T9_9EURO|nr:uncharacterized protein Z517_11989 [Fonsecaea pedrosoi CBS 271.37]KIW75215.1 hypothetical protein Z517_11989 [Fonsecaea pedrosoi CBS 271.37]